MKMTILIPVLSLALSSLAQAKDLHSQQRECTKAAKSVARALLLVNHPEDAKLQPKVALEAPDDSDQMPENAYKTYVTYSDHQGESVVYVVTEMPDDSDNLCRVYDVTEISAN